MKIVALPERWSLIHWLLSDLDESLVLPDSDYYAHGRVLEMQVIANHLNQPIEQAQVTLRQRRHELGGEKMSTVTEAVLSFGISFDDWCEVRTQKCFKPEEYLRPDPCMVKAIKEISQRLSIAVASNSPRELVQRVLQSIGLYPYITQFYGAEDGGAKHNPLYFPTICTRLGVEPRECISMGDRLHVDCEVPLEVGFGGAFHLNRSQTHLVEDVQAVCDLIKSNK